MYLRAASVILALLAASPACAQAFGSVHCKASLRQIDVDLKASQHKVDSVQMAGVDEKCSALRVHLIMLEQESVIVGRCTADEERQNGLAQADASAAAARAEIAKTCGG